MDDSLTGNIFHLLCRLTPSLSMQEATFSNMTPQPIEVNMVHLKIEDVLAGDKPPSLATHVKLEDNSSKAVVKTKVGHVSKSDTLVRVLFHLIRYLVLLKFQSLGENG